MKLTGEENFSLFQRNAVEMSKIIILNRCLLLTKHDEWRMALKTVKSSSNFTSWTAFIHQNAPFWNSTQCSILKMETMYCDREMHQRPIGLWSTLSHREFLLVQWRSSEPQNVYRNIPPSRHSCHTQTP